MLKLQQLPLTTEENKSAKRKRWLRSRRVIAKLSRWLHIYVSMISFVLVLFFAITGLTLNHPDFFAGELKTSNKKGNLDSTWVNGKDSSSINKLQVVEYLRKTHSIRAAVSEFRIEEVECSISFKGPGYGADAFIDRSTGNYEIAIAQAGLIGVLNDLHKGRDSGAGWSVLIDVSAILMTLISLTGIVLLLFIKKKRVSGLGIAAIGLLLAWLVYEIWVK
jgi:uncharacterized protein